MMNADFSCNDHDLYAVVDKSKRGATSVSERRLDKACSKSTTEVSQYASHIYAEVHKSKPKSRSVYGDNQKKMFTMTTEFTDSNPKVPAKIDNGLKLSNNQDIMLITTSDEKDYHEVYRPESSIHKVVPKSNILNGDKANNDEKAINNDEKEHSTSANSIKKGISKSKLYSNNYLALIVADILAFVLIAMLTIMFFVMIWKVSIVESEINRLEQIQNMLNGEMNVFMNTVAQYVNNYNSNFIHLSHSITRLNLTLQNIIYENNTSRIKYISCLDIARSNSSLGSGNYTVISTIGESITVYCDMIRTFGGNSTGWMKVAELDVNNCPENSFTKHVNSSNTCVVNGTEYCTIIGYQLKGIQYTKVTGRVRGYINGSVECFQPYNYTTEHEEHRIYQDGVIITSAEQHIWSFAAGCDCNNISNKPDIVGEDFTADEVTMTESGDGFQNLLWESQQCSQNSTWFLKVLTTPAFNNITVTFCHNQDTELAIKVLELYVQ